MDKTTCMLKNYVIIADEKVSEVAARVNILEDSYVHQNYGIEKLQKDSEMNDKTIKSNDNAISKLIQESHRL